MKTYFLLAFLFINWFEINAQTPWLQDGQKWGIQFGITFIPASLSPLKYEVKGDTVMAGVPCKLIEVLNKRANTKSFRFAYAEGNKVYSYGQETQLFQKIYDFDAVAGDTISFTRFVSGVISQVNYVIDSTETRMFDGVTRAVQYCRFVNNENDLEVFTLPFEIIEGVGMTRPADPVEGPQCAHFLLDEYTCFSAVDGIDYTLMCYEDEEIELTYSIPSYCEYVLSTNNAISIEKANISVYPNPVHDLLNIEWQGSNGYQDCVVRDVTGRLISKLEISGGLGSLSTDSWPNGMYYIELRDSHNQIGCQKFVVIH